MVVLVNLLQDKFMILRKRILNLNELFHWIPWNCAFLEDDVNSAAVNVTDLILAAADDCIPKSLVKKKLNPPWITREVLLSTFNLKVG